MMISRLTVGVMLTVLSVADIKKRQISLLEVFLIAGYGIIAAVMTGGLHFPDLIGGVAIGGALLVLSLVSRKAIGPGDGLLMCATGILLGFKDNAAVLFVGLIICAVFSLVLLILKKAKGTTAVPFIPFLTASYWIVILGKF